MKINFLYNTIGAATLLALSACSKDDTSYNDVNKEDAIELIAGVSNSNGPLTRAASALAEHYAMQGGTAINLRVNGFWTGKDPILISKTTSCSTLADAINDETSDYASTDKDNINALENFSPVLYWNDYGVGDPANATNKEAGLAVLGVAVDGEATAPAVTSDKWEGGLAWEVSTSGSNVLKKDILCANNLTGYKFAQRNDNDARRLDFKHVLSKITVNVMAGDGFTGGKFADVPSVTLTHNVGDATTNNEYLYTGSVNIKECSATATADTYKKIECEAISGTTDKANIQYVALVYPGSELGTTDNAVIAKINADDNIYYVRAKEIRDAMSAASHDGTTTKAGYNYVLNITVNKTEIKVTATITDWVTINADNADPVINVSTSLGGNTTQQEEGFTSFDFYLSDDASASKETAYEKKSTASGTKTDGETPWAFAEKLYWPSHTTHYHMRGVYPSGTTVTAGAISVSNNDYNASSSPSNLMIGMPELSDAEKMCHNTDHTSVDMSEHGICAREANINLNFRYVMSQVEVHLTTPASGNDVVNLTNAKVEIINLYNAGSISIHNRNATTTGETSSFTLNHITDEADTYRHSIIIPQGLTNTTGNLLFRITITNSDGTTDIYEATIKDIKVTEGGVKNNISAWESGKRYVYTLNMRKTEMKVTATLTDWTNVEGDTDIWF